MNRRNFLKMMSVSPLLSVTVDASKGGVDANTKPRKVYKTDFMFQSNLNRWELGQYIDNRYSECLLLQDGLKKVGCLKLKQTGTVTMRENGKFDVTIKRRFMK